MPPSPDGNHLVPPKNRTTLRECKRPRRRRITARPRLQQQPTQQHTRKKKKTTAKSPQGLLFFLSTFTLSLPRELFELQKRTPGIPPAASSHANNLHLMMSAKYNRATSLSLSLCLKMSLQQKQQTRPRKTKRAGKAPRG